MESFGTYLKTEREKQGIRLEEIASITKINIRNLEHLENEKWNKLPPEPFVRGFIAAYAKYINLDSQTVLQKYHAFVHHQVIPIVEVPKEEASNTPKVIDDTVAHSTSSTPEADSYIRQEVTFPWQKIGIGIGAVGFTALLVLIIQHGKNNSPSPSEVSHQEIRESVTEPAKMAEAPVEKSTLTQSELVSESVLTDKRDITGQKEEPKAIDSVASVTAPLPAISAKHEVEVETKHRSWIKVVIDGEAPQELFTEEGKKLTYKANEKIKIVLGNSSEAKVWHNREIAPGKKFQGTIRFYVFPEGARFPQDVPAQKVVKQATGPAPASESPAKKEASPAEEASR